MDLDQRALLEQVARLTEENNVLLRRMQTRARWGTAFRVVYWVVILGIGIGAFYFVQPYIETFNGGVNQLKNDFETFKELVS